MWPNSDTPINCEKDGGKDFCDWPGSEPNGGKNENCMEVRADAYGDGGHWNDMDCNQFTTHYICEKPFPENVKKNAWIGLNDIASTQTVVWTDGSPVTFTKW